MNLRRKAVLGTFETDVLTDSEKVRLSGTTGSDRRPVKSTRLTQSSPHIGIAADPSRKTPSKYLKAAARSRRLLTRSAARSDGEASSTSSTDRSKALPKDRPQDYNHVQGLITRSNMTLTLITTRRLLG